MMMTALLMLSTADANAQGFLKKLKQKAQQAVLGNQENRKDSQDEQQTDYDEPADASKLSVAQGSDIVPKRKTVTITWDGVITPSKSSSATALMNELPPLPSAEKMARSTMEERDAYTQKIAAVLARAEQLQAGANGCSDAEMEALRQKWERKIQDLFGLTKEEQRFEKMSEKEQEAYIRQHPEFMQKMQKMAMNASNFSKQTTQMTAALNGYEAKIGKLMQDYIKFMEREEQHSYTGISKKYEGKLQKLYDDVCAIDDASQIDALYDDADKLLYNYRLEAAKEYRASLERQISEVKKMAAKFSSLSREVVASGDLPECALVRMDLNAVIMVGNLLDKAYKELPKLKASPVCTASLYELPKGWEFCAWECGGHIGGVSDFKTPGGKWPLLAHNEDTEEYAVVENGKFRKIGEDELQTINKEADSRLKKGANQENIPYGTYKSRSGKRTVEYSKSGELIVHGMTTYVPAAFTSNTDRLEWIVFDGNKIQKCTYKK